MNDRYALIVFDSGYPEAIAEQNVDIDDAVRVSRAFNNVMADRDRKCMVIVDQETCNALFASRYKVLGFVRPPEPRYRREEKTSATEVASNV